MKKELSRIFTSDMANLSDEEFDLKIANSIPKLKIKDVQLLVKDIEGFELEDLEKKILRFDSFIRKNGEYALDDHDVNIVIDYAMKKNKVDISLVARVASIMMQFHQLKTLEAIIKQQQEKIDDGPEDGL